VTGVLNEVLNRRKLVLNGRRFFMHPYSLRSSTSRVLRLLKLRKRLGTRLPGDEARLNRSLQLIDKLLLRRIRENQQIIICWIFCDSSSGGSYYRNLSDSSTRTSIFDFSNEKPRVKIFADAPHPAERKGTRKRRRTRRRERKRE
jgi:hypothetical protein